MNFKLKSSFKPTGDQPQAIDLLTRGLEAGVKNQVLLGVTGSGKTYSLANVIQNVQKPTLIISHNKTLAAQLYQEFRDFFPQNAVSYFVSYYDYYQPEAYIPHTDTYIEKETEINEEIDKLRLAATTNLLTRKDTIIVASVSCIYNIGNPKEYANFVLDLRKGLKISRESIIARLVDLQYLRNNYSFKRGTFRILGDNIDIFPAYLDSAFRINCDNGIVKQIYDLDPLNGNTKGEIDTAVIYPAKHYMTNPANYNAVFQKIRSDLEKRVKELEKMDREYEARRLFQRVNFDLEMIQEVGYVNGIENYSRYFDNRSPGDPPFTLLDYFDEAVNEENHGWLLLIDESHMTVPQLRGMYNGDRSRKQTLIDFGFRLPAALDNRPLTFLEFTRRMPQTIYVSATPNEWEVTLARESAAKVILSDPPVGGEPKDLLRMRARTSREIPRQARDDKYGVIEQLIRPTGIVDPQIIIRPTANQIIDLTKEIIKRLEKKERVLVTTLTKKMAEELSIFMNEKKYLKFEEFKNLKLDRFPVVHYLHADIVTLERSDILDDLRSGKYDVIVGINLLREGLDLPEVSLVAILDADKEGFLRSQTALVQTMGRAARHINGTVIMYADEITGSMQRAISEIKRRRVKQLYYNKKNHITPLSILKPIRGKLVDHKETENLPFYSYLDDKKRVEYKSLLQIDENELTPQEKTKLIKKMEQEMKYAAQSLNFELAAQIRDKICKIK